MPLRHPDGSGRGLAASFDRNTRAWPHWSWRFVAMPHARSAPSFPARGLALGLVLILTLPAPAAAGGDPALRAMAARAHAVLVGVCESVRSRWDEGRRTVVTDAVLAVEAYAKGDLGRRVVVTEPGGILPQYNLRVAVADAPRFEAGERALLFVWTDPRGVHRVLGGARGKLAVRTDPTTGELAVHGSPLRSLLADLSR
jgi:hypothetical protein